MADESKRILVEFESNIAEYEQAVIDSAKEVENLKKQIADLKKAEGDHTKEIEQAKTQLREQQSQYKDNTKQLDLYKKAQNSASGSQNQAKAIAALYNKELDKQAGLLEKDANGNLKLSDSYVKAAQKAKNANDAVNQFNLGSKRGYSNVGLYGESIEGVIGKFQNMPGAVGQASSAFSSFSKSLLANPIILAITAIIGAITGLIKILKSTDSGGTWFAAQMEKISAIVDVVRNRILSFTSAIKNIFTGNWREAAVDMAKSMGLIGASFSDAAKAAKDYTYALDEVENSENNFISQKATLKNKIARLEFTAQDRTKTTEERRKALQEAIQLSEEELKFEQKNREKRLNAEVDYLAAKNNVRSQDIIAFVNMTDEEQKNASKSLQELRDRNEEKFNEIEKLYASVIDIDTQFYEENKRNISKLSGFEEEIAKQKADRMAKEKAERDKAQKEIDDNRNKYLAAEKAAEKAIDDFKQKLREEGRKKREAEYQKLLEERRINLENQREIDLLNTESEFEQQRLRLEWQKQAEIKSAEETGASIALINEKYKLKNIEIAQAEKNAKMAIYASIAGALATIFGEQTVLGKAAAVVETTIQTWVGAQNAFAAGSKYSLVLGYANAAAAILVGLSNVKKILSVKTDIKSGGTQQPSTGGAIPRFVATRVNETANTSQGTINSVGLQPSAGSVQNVTNVTNNTSDSSGIVEAISNLNIKVSVEDINRGQSNYAKVEQTGNLS